MPLSLYATSQCFIEMAEQIDLDFDTEAALSNFVPNSVLRKLSNCTSMITGIVKLGGC